MILNSIVSVTEKGVEYEADQMHAVKHIFRSLVGVHRPLITLMSSVQSCANLHETFAYSHEDDRLQLCGGAFVDSCIRRLDGERFLPGSRSWVCLD